MNTAVIALLVCEVCQLTFMVWRDWDHRSYRQSIKDLTDANDSNRRVLISNADQWKREAAYWEAQFQQKSTPDTHGLKEKE